MCGVLGVYHSLSLLSAQSLLQLLIHRGQDASGLCWIDNYNVHQTEKIKGPPSELQLQDEESRVTIGSTRYPTFGTRKGEVNYKKFAQPFSYQTNLGTLSVAHNGNITNMGEIVEDPSIYYSDAELITQKIGEYINELGTLEDALVKIIDVFDGAYSLVGILGTDLFCFRDPRGIRPLVYGYNGIHHIISSESLVLQQGGVNEVEDVQPGQLIRISENNVVKKQLVEPKNIAHCYFEYVYFANSVSTLNGRNVYSARLDLGRTLASQLQAKRIDDKIDYVIPVPDTSKAAAETLAEKLNVPLREGIMKNRSSMRTFIMPSEDARESAAKTKYLFVDEFIRDKSILVVDDSIVRGLTMRYLIKILRDKGAKEVHVAITCPPQRYACYYGVDFGTDSELIASGDKSENEICNEIEADSLTYLNLENLREAIDIDTLCEACLTGEYPTPYGKNIRLRVIEGTIEGNTTHYE